MNRALATTAICMVLVLSMAQPTEAFFFDAGWEAFKATLKSLQENLGGTLLDETLVGQVGVALVLCERQDECRPGLFCHDGVCQGCGILNQNNWCAGKPEWAGVYHFVDAQCSAGQCTAIRNHNCAGLDCPAESFCLDTDLDGVKDTCAETNLVSTPLFLGGESGGTPGADWSVRQQYGFRSTTTACNVATECASWDPNDRGCYALGEFIGMNGQYAHEGWLCADTTNSGAAGYTCWSGTHGETLDVAGASFCCANVGNNPATPTGYKFVAEGTTEYAQCQQAIHNTILYMGPKEDPAAPYGTSWNGRVNADVRTTTEACNTDTHCLGWDPNDNTCYPLGSYVGTHNGGEHRGWLCAKGNDLNGLAALYTCWEGREDETIHGSNVWFRCANTGRTDVTPNGYEFIVGQQTEICDDGKDNDGDGDVDKLDEDCQCKPLCNADDICVDKVCKQPRFLGNADPASAIAGLPGGILGTEWQCRNDLTLLEAPGPSKFQDTLCPADQCPGIPDDGYVSTPAYTGDVNAVTNGCFARNTIIPQTSWVCLDSIPANGQQCGNTAPGPTLYTCWPDRNGQFIGANNEFCCANTGKQGTTPHGHEFVDSSHCAYDAICGGTDRCQQTGQTCNVLTGNCDGTPCANDLGCDSSGLLRCDPARPNTVQICGQTDSDACFEWVDQEICSGDLICQDGNCNPAPCTSECNPSEYPQCQGTASVTCADTNNDGCFERVQESCPSGLCDSTTGLCSTCTDGDNDGFAVEGGTCGPVDCDDGDGTVNPGAAEVCTDNIDHDCDGEPNCDDPDCATAGVCTSCTGPYECALDGNFPTCEGNTFVECIDTGSTCGTKVQTICETLVCTPNGCETPPICGDGVVNGQEACDPGNPIFVVRNRATDTIVNFTTLEFVPQSLGAVFPGNTWAGAVDYPTDQRFDVGLVNVDIRSLKLSLISGTNLFLQEEIDLIPSTKAGAYVANSRDYRFTIDFNTADLDSKTCSDVTSYSIGDLACDPLTCQFNTSDCQPCADECDPAAYPQCVEIVGGSSSTGQVVFEATTSTCERQDDGCFDIVETDCPSGKCDQNMNMCLDDCTDAGECNLNGNFPTCRGSSVQLCIPAANGGTCGQITEIPCLDANSVCEQGECVQYCGDGLVNQPWEECDGPTGTSLGCTDQCQFADATCRDGVFAKVTVDGVRNVGNGDVSDKIFLGSDTTFIPSGTWFPLEQDATKVTDADFNFDVPGLAVQRTATGLLVHEHGVGTSREEVNGTVEFFNAKNVAATGDTTDVLESNDVLTVTNDIVSFELLVGGANDAFTATYDQDNTCAFCGDGIIGPGEVCDPGRPLLVVRDKTDNSLVNTTRLEFMLPAQVTAAPPGTWVGLAMFANERLVYVDIDVPELVVIDIATGNELNRFPLTGISTSGVFTGSSSAFRFSVHFFPGNRDGMTCQDFSATGGRLSCNPITCQFNTTNCCVDNDGDGFNASGVNCGPVDCDDTPGTGASINPDATEVCDDQTDNDCDNLEDCQDTQDCPATLPVCRTCASECNRANFPVCADSTTQTTCVVQPDGCTDLVNTPCTGTDVCTAGVCTPPPPACSDGVDSDGDGLVDMEDPGCACPADPDEDDNSDNGEDVCSPVQPPDMCTDANDAFPTLFSPDTDGDGLHDDCDNCIMDANTNQDDADNDGIGDVCDPDFCISECNPANFPACANSTTVTTCVVQADGCSDLINTTCATGESCNTATNACEVTCTSECDSANFPVCANSTTVTTCEQQTDGCFDLINASCTTGDVCSANACGPPPPDCGDGNLDAGEQCDDNNTDNGDGCSATCVVEYCGDGIVNQPWEECDGTAGCTALCLNTTDVCRDLVLANVNVTNFTNTGVGDASSNIFLGGTPLPSDTWFLIRQNGLSVTDANFDFNVSGLAVQRTTDNLVVELFGGLPAGSLENARGTISFFNGRNVAVAGVTLNSGDSATVSNDVVTFNMTVGPGVDRFNTSVEQNETCEERCGDGRVNATEACDDGNTVDGDGCSATCQVESGRCGNGIVESGEQCDDNNIVSGDGCSATCRNEATGPSCGDGTIQAGETCEVGDATVVAQDQFNSTVIDTLTVQLTFQGGSVWSGTFENFFSHEDNATLNGTIKFDAATQLFNATYTDGTTQVTDTATLTEQQDGTYFSTSVFGDNVTLAFDQVWSPVTSCQNFDSFTGGNLSCNPLTCLFDTTYCIDGNTTQVCGDGVIQPGETCEPVGKMQIIAVNSSILRSTISASAPFVWSGAANLETTYTATVNLTHLVLENVTDTLTIPLSLNAQGNYTGGAVVGRTFFTFTLVLLQDWGPVVTCANFDGFSNIGTLTCSDACHFNTSMCVFPVCGNGVQEIGEQCDLGVSNADSCPSTCSRQCTSRTCRSSGGGGGGGGGFYYSGGTARGDCQTGWEWDALVQRCVPHEIVEIVEIVEPVPAPVQPLQTGLLVSHEQFVNLEPLSTFEYIVTVTGTNAEDVQVDLRIPDDWEYSGPVDLGFVQGTTQARFTIAVGGQNTPEQGIGVVVTSRNAGRHDGQTTARVRCPDFLVRAKPRLNEYVRGEDIPVYVIVCNNGREVMEDLEVEINANVKRSTRFVDYIDVFTLPAGAKKVEVFDVAAAAVLGKGAVTDGWLRQQGKEIQEDTHPIPS
ncbi:MAG: DUF4215 domain-containing protein [Candidatus Woesearchaeota archaeon]|nr:DUF4215 domain-containing protein [Candidatus Woesearchaeota archaeon]